MLTPIWGLRSTCPSPALLCCLFMLARGCQERSCGMGGRQKLFVGSVARVPGRQGWGTLGYRASVSRGVAKGLVL